MAKIEKCNICGVPVIEIKDNICYGCPGADMHCEMEPWMIIEKKVYDYAYKHNLLCAGLKGLYFSAEAIRKKMERPAVAKKAPKYLRQAVSCNGLQFSSIEEFPVGEVLRVCRDSDDDRTFHVGDLVWRKKPKPGFPDTINIIQGAGALDTECFPDGLKGACFEETYYQPPSRKCI